MDEKRLKKLREELEYARTRRNDWDARVRYLEDRCSEAEKLCVSGRSQTLVLSVEQLARLMRSSAASLPLTPGGAAAGTEAAADGQERMA